MTTRLDVVEERSAPHRPGSNPAREPRGVMGWVVRGLLELPAVGFLAWGTLALHFAGPGRGGLADLLAVAWAVVGLAILLLVRPFGRRLTTFAAAVAVLLVWWSTIRPSNDRTWLADVARTPHGELSGDRLTIHDLRNFDYRSETDFTERWETRTYDLSGLDRLDFFLSYWGSPKIAHTIVSWAFQDGQHLAVSIETRKEVGESYDALAGFFRQYELIREGITVPRRFDETDAGAVRR